MERNKRSRISKALWSKLAVLAIALTSSCSKAKDEDLQWPTCPYEDAVSPSHCGCEISPPIDLTANAGIATLWTFGLHAQSGHVEGHRGLDMVSSAGPIEVVSPVDGVIFSIDNNQDESGSMLTEYEAHPNLHYTTINADCGLRVSFIPLILDGEIVAGTRVTRGQRLGVLARTATPWEPDPWTVHFEIDARASATDSALYAVCPADFFTESEVSTLETMLANSTFPEKLSRTVHITCEDQSTLSMSYAGEESLCNARLSPEQHQALAACVPSKAWMIW